MNKWQTITEVVKVFVSSGHPGYAFVLVLSLFIGLASIAAIIIYSGPVVSRDFECSAESKQ